tara:strand:+ start:166 stop:1773 length:1608 start_codon:yes stop_codon:yes gene_type:complete
MAAYSYIRFSSKKQELGDSYRRQTELAVKWCKDNGHQLSDVRYEDLGVSGWTGANQLEDSGLSKFKIACESGAIEKGSILIVESLDRLSRANIETAITQLVELVQYVDIVTIEDGTIYRKGMDASHFIIASIHMERAHKESQLKSERVKAAWQAKRDNPENAIKTKTCPFWLSVSDDKKSYIPNEKVIILQRIFNLRIKGIGAYKISKLLNDEGITSPTGKTWNAVTISNTLRNRAVLGEYRPNYINNKIKTPTGLIISNHYPSIIDKDLFDRVQVVIDKSAIAMKNTKGGSTTSHKNILKGIGKCNCCGSELVMIKGAGIPYIRCRESRKGSGCPSKNISLKVFYRFLHEHLLDPSLYAHRWSVNNEQLAKIDLELDKIETEKEKIIIQLKQVSESMGIDIDTLINGSKPLHELKERKLELGTQREGYKGDTTHLQDMELMRTILANAEREDNEPDAIEARLKVRDILSSFSGLTIDSQNYTYTLKLTDNEKVRTFVTPRYPLKVIAKVSQLWEITDVTELERENNSIVYVTSN